MYCPAGVKSRLPSGAKVSRLKNEVYVSLAYMLVFLNPPRPENGIGECSIGRTAGKGIEGAGEADLRTDGEEAKDERRLCVNTGGFIGSAKDVGVPGIDADGAGEAGAMLPSSGAEAFWFTS